MPNAHCSEWRRRHTYGSAVQLVDAAGQKHAGAKMRGHVHDARHLLEVGHRLVGGGVGGATVALLVRRRVRERRRELLPKILWVRVKWIALARLDDWRTQARVHLHREYKLA